MSETFNPLLLAAVETLKLRIGWNWNEMATRIGWGIMTMTQFRNGKRGMDPRLLDFLKRTAEAIEAVEKPVNVPLNPIAAAPQPTLTDGPDMPEPAGAGLFSDAPSDGTTRIKVMTLDDIAAKIALEYAEIANEAGISSSDLGSARWALGRLAERLGVIDEVKAAIGQARATQPSPAVPRPPPVSPRAATIPVPLPREDREEWSPPQRQRVGSFADDSF